MKASQRYALTLAQSGPLTVYSNVAPATLKSCTARGWLEKTTGERGPRWTITDAGRAALATP